MVYSAVTSLDCLESAALDDTILSRFPSLRILSLSYDDGSIIGDATVSGCVLEQMTALTSLDLSRNVTIGNETLSRLTTLTRLSLSANCLIENDGISRLTNLTDLNLASNRIIIDEALFGLDNLTKLNLTDNYHIAGDSVIFFLPNLTTLIMRNCLVFEMKY
jgi:Leucine-rich repeat (LRR) protein